jgi:hypothetical protein
MGGGLTLVMPYFDNSSMLELQYEGWRKWPESIRDRFRVVIVDDGSESAPAGIVARPEGVSVEIYRVLVNIPWHQHGARNLGAKVAPEGWLLLTDMDHVLTAESAAVLFERMDRGKLDPSTVYMLDRVEVDTGKPTLDRNGNPKPHPNSFVMTRDMYWRIGGYDEDLTGVYGTDRYFRDRAYRFGKRGHLNIPLVRYWRDIVSDASTNGLPRKEGREVGAKERILAAKRARGEADVVKVLQFPWERIV